MSKLGTIMELNWPRTGRVAYCWCHQKSLYSFVRTIMSISLLKAILPQHSLCLNISKRGIIIPPRKIRVREFVDKKYKKASWDEGKTDLPRFATSKTMSYLLRHGGIKEGLKIREDGYMKVSDLVCRLPILCYTSVNGYHSSTIQN
jgi:ribosomal protein L31E